MTNNQSARNNNNNNYRLLIMIENKIKRAKIALIILSLLQLLIVFIYISLKRNLTHLIIELKDDMFIFNLISYFGLSFSLAGLIVALFENYCFMSCFAITNLGHLIIVMTRTKQFILFAGYFAINICIILVSFLFCHLLRMKMIQLHLQRSIYNRNNDNNIQNGTIFNIHENLFRQQILPPSYKEVIKHPDKYPCLCDTIQIPPPSSYDEQQQNDTAKAPDYSTIHI